eukprot:scaffold57009_cov20-Tisochrysis_lutea.AAC.1
MESCTVESAVHCQPKLAHCSPHLVTPSLQWYSYLNFLRYAWSALMRNQFDAIEQTKHRFELAIA